MARVAVPTNLRILLARSRSLAFKAKRKGSILLREEARRLRNFTRSELKRFQQEQLAKSLTARHKSGSDSVLFWNRTKRHFRTASSSLRGLISSSGESFKDPQNMANLAADYYEQLFEEPVVVRPHPYVDTTPPILDNHSDPIPLVTYPEILKVLVDRGILPDSQSGFRAGHRLQTRVLLLIEQISSYMSNSAPVATVFVDFKSAFDQLWFEGCLGKLTRMGIPLAFVKWIRVWLEGRRATIDIQGKRSRWFSIRRGGPQGSSFTPTLFIAYHADMEAFIPMAMSFFFADDLAAVVAGQMGIRYTDQCIDLERRLHSFFVHLEYYSALAVQPINYSKTQVMWSARA
ncbi:unnamed protein product, partial [Rotaria sp. Silwood2]